MYAVFKYFDVINFVADPTVQCTKYHQVLGTIIILRNLSAKFIYQQLVTIAYKFISYTYQL